MAKVTLPTIQSGFLSAEAMNSALAAIEVAFENTYSRNGATPNQLEADLDLNGHTLLNAGFSDDPNRVVTLSEVNNIVAEQSSGLLVQKLERQIAAAGQTLFTLATFVYEPAANNLAVYVNGSRIFVPDYTETNASSITFLVGLLAGDEVDFVVNDFLSTVTLPAHNHTWSQINGAPSFATRDPTWDEVTSKPATFTPSAHTHDAADIVSGRFSDIRRGIWVQATEPTANTVGELWFW